SVDAADLHLSLVRKLNLTVQSEWRTRWEHLDKDLADGCRGCLVRSLQVDARLKGHVVVPFRKFPLSCCHNSIARRQRQPEPHAEPVARRGSPGISPSQAKRIAR